MYHVTFSNYKTCKLTPTYLYQNNEREFCGNLYRSPRAWLAQSVQRLATGWVVLGSNPVTEGARFSAPVQTGPGAHPASCTIGTGSFPGVKSGRGVTLTPHLYLVALVMKEQSYTSTPPMGRTACTEPQCLYKGALKKITLQKHLQPSGTVPASLNVTHVVSLSVSTDTVYKISQE